MDFEIIPSPYVEPHDRTDFSYAYVEDLAYNKALEVAKILNEQAQVIGADTIVVIDNKILGKLDKVLFETKDTLKNTRRKETLCLRQVSHEVAIEKSAWFHLALLCLLLR